MGGITHRGLVFNFLAWLTVSFTIFTGFELIFSKYYEDRVEVISPSGSKYYKNQQGYEYNSAAYQYVLGVSDPDQADADTYYDAGSLARNYPAFTNEFFTKTDNSAPLSGLKSQCEDLLSDEVKELGRCPPLDEMLGYLYFKGGENSTSKIRKLLGYLGNCNRGGCVLDDSPTTIRRATGAPPPWERDVNDSVNTFIYQSYLSPALQFTMEGQCDRASVQATQASELFQIYDFDPPDVTTDVSLAHLASSILKDVNRCKQYYPHIYKALEALNNVYPFDADQAARQHDQEDSTSINDSSSTQPNESEFGTAIQELSSTGAFNDEVKYLRLTDQMRSGKYIQTFIGFEELSNSTKGDIRQLALLMSIRCLHWAHWSGQAVMTNDEYKATIDHLSSEIERSSFYRDAVQYASDSTIQNAGQ